MDRAGFIYSDELKKAGSKDHKKAGHSKTAFRGINSTNIIG